MYRYMVLIKPCIIDTREITLSMQYPIGISDFKEIALGNYTLVDKSLLINDILNDGAKVILITRCF